MKKIIISTNWKLNGDLRLIKKMSRMLNSKTILKFSKILNIVIGPPSVYLDRMKKKLFNKNIFLAAQNIDINQFGAYTGEISVDMIKEIGAKYVFVGHSERRKNHQETNFIVSKKFNLIKKLNLIPILCIGENFKEKNSGKTYIVLKKQIKIILKNYGKNAFKNSCIAYEPVWAIGSGKSANPEYINKIHKFIKNYIFKKINFKKKYIKNFFLQYGGSVTEKNVLKIIKKKHVDGVLIGSNSLDCKTFFKILKIIFKNFFKKNI